MRRLSVLGLLVLVAFFAVYSPLVNVDGNLLTVDTPLVVLAEGPTLNDESADQAAPSDGDCSESDVYHPRHATARHPVALVVAARWALVLRRWHRAFTGGVPS